VTIDTLVAEPLRYANAFLVVQGLYADGIARPACTPWIGPPIGWSLSNGQKGLANHILNIKSAFPDEAQPVIPDSFYMKELITLHGWLRRYDGPVGCPGFDQQGHSLLDQMEQQHVWYFEAVQLDSTASIEWHRPQDPTPTPPPMRPTVTPQQL
jgi:hypothetical protein